MGARASHILRQVGASSAVTLAVLVGAELAMRGVDLPDPGLYVGDRAWVWWLRPGLDRPVTDPLTERTVQVRTSAEGFRGPGPPESGPWVLALGCSTTFGWAVEADAAWPAQLEARLGQPVVNGGVPGWSTAQGVRGGPPLLAHRPSQVVLGFGVRDAQRAPRPDAEATPTPWLLRTRWALLLGRAHAARAAAPRDGGVPRVDAAAFADNLRTLVDQVRAVDAEPIVLLFPQPEPWPPEGYLAAAEATGVPVLAPTLPREAFFAADPIHLQADGHAALADWLAERWPG